MTTEQITQQQRLPLRRRSSEGRLSTRQQLLEAAGHVFAEKGFHRATGKEICERAGANTAAINYYFGSMEGLYAAVLEEAHGRLITLEKLKSAIAGKPDAKAKLAAIVDLAVDLLTGPLSSSWVLRAFGREIITPSFALDALIERQAVPKLRILRSIVAELMGLPEDHPGVARGCLSVVAPFAMLLLADRQHMQKVMPGLGVGREDASALKRHMLAHTLGGLAAAGREVRDKTGRRAGKPRRTR